MARIYGLNGALRGKQGNNVFSVQNGTQVVKAYQPVVSNPRSIGQREQRSKMALAGKMSSATPSIALSGMAGASLRSKRARFVQNILRSATVSGTIDALEATIPFEDVVYSEGSISQWRDGMALTAAWSDLQTGRDRVNVSFTAGTLLPGVPTGYSELRIVALYDAATSTLEEVQVKEVQSTATLNFVFREHGRRDVIIVGYIVPFVRLTSRNAPVSSGLYGTVSNVSLNVTANALISGAEFGHSVCFGVATLQGVTSSVAPPADDNRGSSFETNESGETMRKKK